MARAAAFLGAQQKTITATTPRRYKIKWNKPATIEHYGRIV